MSVITRVDLSEGLTGLFERLARYTFRCVHVCSGINLTSTMFSAAILQDCLLHDGPGNKLYSGDCIQSALIAKGGTRFVQPWQKIRMEVVFAIWRNPGRLMDTMMYVFVACISVALFLKTVACILSVSLFFGGLAWTLIDLWRYCGYAIRQECTIPRYGNLYRESGSTNVMIAFALRSMEAACERPAGLSKSDCPRRLSPLDAVGCQHEYSPLRRPCSLSPMFFSPNKSQQHLSLKSGARRKLTCRSLPTRTGSIHARCLRLLTRPPTVHRRVYIYRHVLADSLSAPCPRPLRIPLPGPQTATPCQHLANFLPNYHSVHPLSLP